MEPARPDIQASIRLSELGSGERISAGYAPGRATVLGDHVDYVLGDVLAIALPVGVGVALRRRRGEKWRIAEGKGDPVSFAMNDAPSRYDRLVGACSWFFHEFGVGSALEIAVSSSLPEGAGLSSSAAVILSALVALHELAGIPATQEELVSRAWKVEHEWLGIPCGTLDQRTIVGGKEGSLLHLELSKNAEEFIPWKSGLGCLVLCDTGVSHDVGGEAYAAKVEKVTRMLSSRGIPSIADCSEEDLATLLREEGGELIAHCASEHKRVLDAIVAIGNADGAALGKLMNESHESLTTGYRVGHLATDLAAGAATSVPGCRGARMVGAGFGGSVIALVDESAQDAVAAAMREALSGAGYSARMLSAAPSDGIARLYDMTRIGRLVP